MKLFSIPLLLTGALFLISCGSEDDDNPTPTSTDVNTNIPEILWTNSIGTSTVPSTGAISIDAQSNVHLVGDYTGNPTFDPLPQVTVGLPNAFYVQLGKTGEATVIQDLGLSVADRLDYLKLGSNGNVFIAGRYIPDANKVFLFRLDGQGGQLGTTIINGSSTNDVPGGLAIDNSGNIIIGGTYRGTINYNNGDSYGGALLGSSSAVKLNPSQEAQWSYFSPIQAVTRLSNVDVDPIGNVYIYECADQLSYLRKLSPDGEEIWTSQSGSCAIGLKVVSEDEIYLNQQDGVSRINSSGEIVWQLSSSTILNDLDANQRGDIVVCGLYFTGSFGNIELREPATSSSARFIAMINADGSARWVSTDIPATDVAINDNGEIAYANFTDTSIQFGLISAN